MAGASGPAGGSTPGRLARHGTERGGEPLHLWLVVDWGAAFDWVAAAMLAWAVSGGAGLLWLGAYNAGRRDSYIEEIATLVMTSVLVSGGLVAAVVWNLVG